MNLKTVNETAAILRLSPITIRAWIAVGKLRAIRIGPRSIRIAATEIEGIAQPAVQRCNRFAPKPQVGTAPKRRRSSLTK